MPTCSPHVPAVTSWKIGSRRYSRKTLSCSKPIIFRYASVGGLSVSALEASQLPVADGQTCMYNSG